MMICAKKTAIFALALALGACGGASSTNYSLNSIHQPTVQNHTLVYDLATENGALTAAAKKNLSGWLDALRVDEGDRIAIGNPAGSGMEAAKSSVAEILSARGVLLAQHAPAIPKPLAKGYLRVTLVRSSASVDSCPDFPSQYASNVGNRTSANYGCSINSNLAAMIADPNDLVEGQAADGHDSRTASRPVDEYRERGTSGGGGGQVSNVGTSGGG